jgi:hypothetical protein
MTYSTLFCDTIESFRIFKFKFLYLSLRIVNFTFVKTNLISFLHDFFHINKNYLIASSEKRIIRYWIIHIRPG